MSRRMLAGSWLATFLIQFRITCLGIGVDHRGLVLPISVNNHENPPDVLPKNFPLGSSSAEMMCLDKHKVCQLTVKTNQNMSNLRFSSGSF